MNGKRINCIQCENDFVISQEELDFLQARGFDEPRRCPLCRKRKSRSSDQHNTGRRNDKKKHYRMKYENDPEKPVGSQRMGRVKGRSDENSDDDQAA